MTRKQVVHFTGSGPAWPASYVGFYSNSGATTPVTVYSDQIASTVLASGKTGSSPVRKLRADNLGQVPPPALGIGLYVDSSVTTLYARPETVTGVAVSGAAAVSVASFGPDGPITPPDPSSNDPASKMPLLATTAWTSGPLNLGVNTVDATAGAKTPALPVPSMVGQLCSVEKTDASTNTVTISGTIRGSAGTLVLTSQFQSIVLEAESLSSWRPIADHRTAAALSATSVPITGGVAVTGTEPHLGDTSFIPNVGPILTAPGGQQMRVRVNALGILQADPIGAIQPAVFIPLLGSTTPVTGTGSSMVINVPSGTVSGSVMVAVIDNRGSQTINTPTGWTLIRTVTAGSFDSTPQLSTFYRVAGGSEPASYTWTFSASTIFSGSIATFGNVNTTTPIAGSVQTTGSSGGPSLQITGVPSYGMGLFAAAVDSAGGANGVVTDTVAAVPVWDVAQGPYAQSHLSLISAPPAGGTVKATASRTPSGANFSAQLVALNPASVVSTALPQLRWAPPNTSGYTPLTINSNGGVQQTINLSPNTDYVISAPSAISGGVVLAGGRNVVWVGGEINIPTQADDGTSDNIKRRALLISGQTGVVHLEGILFDGADINEGIDVASPLAVVQIQNCRAVGMHARDETGFTDNHVDFIQSWGGCLELRVDKCTFQSDYQGITIADQFNNSRHVCRISRVNGKAYNNLGQYFYWWGSLPGQRGDVYLEDVWAPSDAATTLIGNQVWPDQGNQITAFPQRASVGSDGTSPYASWPSQLSPMIVGLVRQGQPSGGDFAPSGTPGAGIAGAGYTTPGYQYASYVAPVIYSTLLGPLASTGLSDFSPAAPTVSGQVPTWDGSKYVPTAPGAAAAQIGYDFPRTFVGHSTAAASSNGSTNAARYSRFITGGSCSKIGVQIGTSSGNISVAIYRNSGVGSASVPGTRVVTTGAIACPATGYQEIALGSTVTVNAGDWLGVSMDTTSPTMETEQVAQLTNLAAGAGYLQSSSAHPCPATPSSLSAATNVTQAIGVA